MMTLFLISIFSLALQIGKFTKENVHHNKF
jgi:hypothetical protein